MVFDAAGNILRKQAGFTGGYEIEKCKNVRLVDLIAYKELPSPFIFDEEFSKEKGV